VSWALRLPRHWAGIMSIKRCARAHFLCIDLNWLLFKNSLLVGVCTTLLAGLFGYSAALWLSGIPRRCCNCFWALCLIALVLPPFLVTNCWLHFLGHTGVWRNWVPLDIFSISGTVWVLSLILWPLTTLTVWSAWQRLEPLQLESDVAVTGWALFCALLWPLSRNALGQAGVLTLVLALNNFAVPAILQVKVFSAEMWIHFNTSFDTVGTLKLSWPLVTGPLLLIVLFARRSIPWPHIEPAVAPKLFRRQLGSGWMWLSGSFTILICFLSVGLPLLQIFSVQRTWTELPGALAAGESAVWNSFWFAAAAATAIVILSFLKRTSSGEHSDFRALRGSVRFDSLLWLPFLLPGVLVGIGLIIVFNRPWAAVFYQSPAIVVLAFSIRYFGFGWTAIARARQTVDTQLVEVARLEGANHWQLLRHVYWPQIAPQVLAVWYIVFLLCLWDVESMILVVPPGGETLALRTFNLLHYGHNAQVNALCLVLLAVALAPWALWHAFSALRSAWTLTLPAILIGSAAACLFVGCSPPSSSTVKVIQSRIFARVEIIGTRGVGVGQLNKPRSVAVDQQDNLYVVDMTGRVQKFYSNGVFVLSWQMPVTDLGKPKGMCRDREGNILVLEPHYSRLNHFSPEGKLLLQWGEHGTNCGQFSLPRAVAVNSKNEIFVSEYQGIERVQKFGSADPSSSSRQPESNRGRAPRWLASFGQAGTGPGEFNRAEGLFLDTHDRLYVADSCNHRIQIFSNDGKFLRSYGKPGKGVGQFSYPYDICVDQEGRQYVCEFGNSRIQVFDAKDQPIEIIGGPGGEPGWFSNPWSLALDSAGNLYVADSQNHRVQKFVRKESAPPR